MIRALVAIESAGPRKRLATMLRERGHVVTLIGDGDVAAVEQLADFELLLVEAASAETAALIEAVRAQPGGSYPVIAALSDGADDATIEAVATAGATLFWRGDQPMRDLWTTVLGIEALVRERTRARDELQWTAEAMLRSRAKTDALLSALPDMMFRLSRSGEYLDFRAPDPGALAAPPESLIGMNMRDLFPAEMLISLEEAIETALAELTVQVVEYALDTPRGRRDFEARVVASNPDEVIALVRDVTDRKQLANQLQMADRLSAMGTLIAGMAHEINNPMTYILIGVDSVLRDLRDQQPDRPLGDRLGAIQQRLRDALEGAQRVRRIVAHLKAFARANETHDDAIELRPLLDRVCAMVHDEIQPRARLVRDYRDTARVACNPDLLTQVFLHLLLNAIQALDTGAGDVNFIRVATRTDDSGRAVVDIADSGHGIPGDLLDKIFDPFFTTKPSGVGTGLGLWMSQTIIARYGGTIEVDSKLGEGTIVRVALPGEEPGISGDSRTPSRSGTFPAHGTD